jgi:hypothetical protein
VKLSIYRDETNRSGDYCLQYFFQFFKPEGFSQMRVLLYPIKNSPGPVNKIIVGFRAKIFEMGAGESKKFSI